MSIFDTQGKSCKTRDGRDVRVIADDVNTDNGKRIAIIITSGSGTELIASRFPDGQSITGESAGDLIPPRLKLEIWYKDGSVCAAYSDDNTKTIEELGWRKITVEEVE